MFESAAAAWLNTNLAGFDHLFLSIQHFFAEHLGGILTPIMRAITFLGEKGWPFFLLALIFMLTASKRDLGVCIFGAVCCGALITNIILKDNVARPRPFESSVDYELWWMAVGSPAEDGFSFPSGHVTACAAAMTAITLMRGKKWIVPSVVIVLLMMISRNYLMAHYPSDVCAALLIGIFSGIVAWFITQIIFRFLNRKRKTIPICGWLLDFDIRDILPFRLPAIPFLKGKKAAKAAPVKAAGPAAGDDDVKTYASKRAAAAPAKAAGDRAAAAPVKAAESSPSPRRAERIRSAEPAPKAAQPAARSESAPVRSGGRHALPESGAKKSTRRTPANYQGKH